jgi:hypothetical protein
MEFLSQADIMKIITPKKRARYRISDLMYTIQRKTIELCSKTCEKVPQSIEDCVGYLNGKLVCLVRRIKDNANFQAERVEPNS